MKTLQQILTLIILGLLTIIQLSCENWRNSCPDEYLGEYKLLENARDSLPYLQDSDLIFKDADGNLAVFEFRKDQQGYIEFEFQLENICELDPERKYLVYARGDTYNYVLREKTSTLGFDITISLSLRLESFFSSDYDAYDGMLLKIGGNSHFLSALNLMINQREFDDEYLYLFDTALPEITLLDKTFYNVYTNSTHSEYKNSWYNTEFGIVGFEDTSGKLWVFDSSNAL